MNDAELVALVTAACNKGVLDNVRSDVAITIDSTFADLGLDSIGALQIVAFVEDRLGIQLPDSELSEIADVRGLASLLQRLQG